MSDQTLIALDNIEEAPFAGRVSVSVSDEDDNLAMAHAYLARVQNTYRAVIASDP